MTGIGGGCAGAAAAAGAAPPPPPPPPPIIIIIIIIIGSIPPCFWVARPLMESVMLVSMAVSCASLPPAREETRDEPPETFSRSLGSIDANMGACLDDMGEGPLGGESGVW